MKRKKRMIIPLVFLLLFLMGCSEKTDLGLAETMAKSNVDASSETVVSATTLTEAMLPTDPTIPEEIIIQDCEDVFSYLEKAGFDLVYTIIYDEKNDPNGSGEWSYIQKAGFVDGRIEENGNEDSPLSGTIEIFASPAEARARAEYINSQTYRMYASEILADCCLLRLGYAYSEEDVCFVAESIRGEVFIDLNSSVYATLSDTVQLNEYLLPISPEWNVEGIKKNMFYIYPNDSNGLFTVEFNSSTRIRSGYLTFLQGIVDGFDAKFIKAEMTFLENGTDAIRGLFKCQMNDLEYYINTFAFDDKKGYYAIVMLDPVDTNDKIEVYFEEIISGLRKNDE